MLAKLHHWTPAAFCAVLSVTLIQPPAMTGTEPPFRLVFEAEWNDITCIDYPLTPGSDGIGRTRKPWRPPTPIHPNWPASTGTDWA